LDSWRNRHRCQTGEITVADGCGEIIIAAIGFVEEPLCRRQTRIRTIVSSPRLSRNGSSDWVKKKDFDWSKSTSKDLQI
jgi:hypothetical protein